MADLIKEGKITHWGMSEATEENIRKANLVCPLTAIQNRYSMMARHYESLFPVLEEFNIGFVAFSPLANGFLSGKYNENSKFEKARITEQLCHSSLPTVFVKIKNCLSC